MAKHEKGSIGTSMNGRAFAKDECTGDAAYRWLKQNTKAVRAKKREARQQQHLADKKSRREKKRDRQYTQAQGICPNCVNSYIDKTVRTFANGTMHVEQRCGTCGKFIKWGD